MSLDYSSLPAKNVYGFSFDIGCKCVALLKWILKLIPNTKIAFRVTFVNIFFFHSVVGVYLCVVQNICIFRWDIVRSQTVVLKCDESNSTALFLVQSSHEFVIHKQVTIHIRNRLFNSLQVNKPV